MAVHDEMPEIEVTFQVDARSLEEYEHAELVYAQPDDIGKHRRAKTVLKYIEAQTDKEFTVNLVYIDGVNVVNSVIAKSLLSKLKEKEWTDRCQGSVMSRDVEKGTETILPFKFTSLETSSDEARDVNEDKESAEYIGQIIVDVHRGSQPFIDRKSFNKKTKVESPSKLHEKAIKGEAKSHITSHGEEIVTREPEDGYVDCKLLGSEKYPLAIFQFEYRSKEALKQLLVIERTPELEPSPTPEPAFLQTLSPEQRKEMELYMERQKGVVVKRERQTLNDGPRKKGSGKGWREVVDLTGDV